MTFEKWVVHTSDLEMMSQKLRDAQSVLILALDTNCQSLNTAKQQPRGVRIHNATQRGPGFVNLLNQILAASNNAGNQVRVSAKIFRARVHHQINAKFHRAL